MAKVEHIHPGDKVQVTRTAIDITNGVRAGTRYVEGSSEWGIVQLIDPNWKAAYGDHKGQIVTKVRILGWDNTTVVWQVIPQHVSDNIIHTNDCQPEEEVPVPEPEIAPAATEVATSTREERRLTQREKDLLEPPIPPKPAPPIDVPAMTEAFTTTPQSDTWRPPINDTNQAKLTEGVETSTTANPLTPYGVYDNEENSFERIIDSINRDLSKYSPVKLNRTRIPNPLPLRTGLSTIETIEEVKSFDVEDPDKKRLMLNDIPELIQNEYGYPVKDTAANYKEFIPARYDYTITLDSELPRGVRSFNLEDRLMQARAAFGIPVHGNTDMAKTMRYYLYNRFKSPDINLAHSRTFTHIFFTRPDLNILTKTDPKTVTITENCQRHTESAMLWLKDPALFKMLVDCNRCGDSNNFNMLLSNSVTSIQLEEETLNINETGRSWHDYAIQYGESYNGRSAGEFSVGFTDDKFYSIFHLIKLWMTYIDNVARGAWMPSYDLDPPGRIQRKVPEYVPEDSHVYTKTLDYPASVYVFKVGEDGSNIIYWTKYYGVFPVNTGATALSWDIGQSIGDVPKLNIRFRYSFKRDMSPVSLLEFNSNARVADGKQLGAVPYEESWASEYNHSNRPFVGSPFVQFKLPSTNPELRANSASTDNTASIRLMFQPDYKVIGKGRDREMYRSTIN